jgi:hypothetical protein
MLWWGTVPRVAVSAGFHFPHRRLAMTKLLPLTAALCLLSAAAPPEKFSFVDLEPYANQKLTDGFGSGVAENNLAALAKGGQTFAGVNFKLGKSVIQLDSKLLNVKRPTKVEGIKVGKSCAKIHILHACEYGNGSGAGQEGKDGDPLFVKDGTQIAEYKVHYADGSSASIPVVYGEDVRDWWFTPTSKGVSRGKVAWTGDNDYAKELNSRLRVYLTSWDNPHPAKTITSIDFARTGDSPAAPFCVAITLEAK